MNETLLAGSLFLLLSAKLFDNLLFIIDISYFVEFLILAFMVIRLLVIV